MKILKSFFIWLCFIPAAILNGGLREYVLVKTIGEKWALPVSGILLSTLIFLITWFLFPRIVGGCTSKESRIIGIVWVLLTILFEFATGLGTGNTVQKLLVAYNPLTGNLWLLILLTTFLSPVLVEKNPQKNRKSRGFKL